MWIEWWKKARTEERALIFKIIGEIEVYNEHGPYVYVEDLREYLEEHDAKARR